MLSTISNVMKVVDLRKRILFTLAIFIVYRIGAFIPVPNINTDVFKMQDQANTNSVFGLLNTFSGGALSQFSIFAMGIMPYITASIIVQLLSMDVVPRFAQWAKEGEMGRKKMTQVTRYGTILLGLIQSYGLAIGFNRATSFGLVIHPSFGTYTLIAIVLTAGTTFLMWLGEQITENGIGNGISIIIFAGIIARFPTYFRLIYQTEFTQGANVFYGIVKIVLILIVVALVIVAVIYIQQGVRKIPVQYAKRVVGRKMYGGQSTHIPLKVNAAGVIPVIFAMSLVTFPRIIASYWSGHPIADWIINNLNYNASLGLVLYVLLIIGFTYFYTFVQINPVQMAEQMKKNGGYIPGIRPGKTTVVYLTRVMNRITLAGAIFLAAISVLPMAFITLANLPNQVRIGGTALLIVVGVALETMKMVESQLIKRHYKGFINK